MAAVDRDGEQRRGVGEPAGVVGVDEGDPGQTALGRAVVAGPGGQDDAVGTPAAVVVGVPGGGDRAGAPALGVVRLPAVGAGGRGRDGQRLPLLGRAVGGVPQGVVGGVEDGADAHRVAHRGGEPVEPGARYVMLRQPQVIGGGDGGQGLQLARVVGHRGLRGADHRGGARECEGRAGQGGAQRPAPPASAVSAAMLHETSTGTGPTALFGGRVDRGAVGAVRRGCYDRRTARRTRTLQICEEYARRPCRPLRVPPPAGTPARHRYGPAHGTGAAPVHGAGAAPFTAPVRLPAVPPPPEPSSAAAGHGGRAAGPPRSPRRRRNDTAGAPGTPRGTS